MKECEQSPPKNKACVRTSTESTIIFDGHVLRKYLLLKEVKQNIMMPPIMAIVTQLVKRLP